MLSIHAYTQMYRSYIWYTWIHTHHAKKNVCLFLFCFDMIIRTLHTDHSFRTSIQSVQSVYRCTRTITFGRPKTQADAQAKETRTSTDVSAWTIDALCFQHQHIRIHSQRCTHLHAPTYARGLTNLRTMDVYCSHLALIIARVKLMHTWEEHGSLRQHTRHCYPPPQMCTHKLSLFQHVLVSFFKIQNVGKVLVQMPWHIGVGPHV